MFSTDLEDLISRVRGSFTDTILKRGWRYYLDGVVTNLTIEKTILRATVVGTTPYLVRIDLASFSSSSCTCPYGDYCKHMAAVLFEALGKEGSKPIELLYPTKKLAIKYAQLKTNSITTNKQAVNVPRETESCEEWHRLFDEIVEKRAYFGAYSLESFYVDGKKVLDPFCHSWNPAMKSLYRLHMWLFLMKRIDEMYEQGNKQYVYHDSFSYHRSKAMQWLHELVHFIETLNNWEIRKRHESYFLSTINYLAQNAFPLQNTVMDWSAAYCFLWSRLLFHEPWAQMEQQRLRMELAEPQSSSIRKDALVKALVFFEITFQNDNQAMEIAEEAKLDDVDLFFSYLRSFSANEQWSRMVAWLHWLRPQMKDSNRGLLGSYLYFWREVYERNLVEDNEWEQVLLLLLPESYREYADYLIDTGKYQEWVDLHLFYESSPSELKSVDVKEVETQNRRCLLPLYHQAVERCILEKNRDSYKKSVKLLKKLRIHYRQLKEQPRWDRYIETLSTTYKRYRAFQEELQKGKLIP